jgi:hypothetical protein
MHNGDVGEGDVSKVEQVSIAASLSELSGTAKYWVGKDYTNFIVKDFTNVNLPYQGNDYEPGPALPR